MRLCSDMLLKDLSQYVKVECIGEKRMTLSLNPPIFYSSDLRYQNDIVYIGRIGELPPPPEGVSCQIICVGGVLPPDWEPGSSCAFSISSEADILHIFNIVQGTFIRYNEWDMKLSHILETTANLEEMIQQASKLLGRSITLINNQLEIIVQSEQGDDDAKASMTPAGVRLWADSHKRNTSMRDPFFFQVEGMSTYCINVYIHDAYWGMLAMAATRLDILSEKIVLFQYFYNIFLKALKKNINNSRGNMITLKTVLTDLLKCLPVSSAKLEKACRNSGQEGGPWICAALRPVGAMNNLPREYFCRQLENRFPGSNAIEFNSYIVLYLMLEPEQVSADGKYPFLESGLAEVGLPAGISLRFENILKARGFFRQAVIALEMACSLDPGSEICYFKDYALSYVLKNSIGELKPDFLIPSGLLKLKKEEHTGTDDWNTLKVYLDNEMNASQTARELFIHRTTLQIRLNRIRESVDLDTAKSRLYIRYCIYLYELFQRL
ncbi:MAG: PucR family transcriptional regulator [Blautia sp.]|jgi:hypothetical protein